MDSWPKKVQYSTTIQWDKTEEGFKLEPKKQYAIFGNGITTLKYIWLLNVFINPNYILLQIKQFLGKLDIKYFLDILTIEL